jgi:hypothetical protein
MARECWELGGWSWLDVAVRGWWWLLSAIVVVGVVPTSISLLFDDQPSLLGCSVVLVAVDPPNRPFRVECSGHHQCLRRANIDYEHLGGRCILRDKKRTAEKRCVSIARRSS